MYNNQNSEHAELGMDKRIGLLYKKYVRKLIYFFYCFYLLALFYIFTSALRIIIKKLYCAI